MIRFSHVTKQFGDNPPSLENISFDVNKGEFVFLTGPSGSGKTTLLKLLIKEYTPNDGDVEFEGESLNTLRGSRVHHHRRKIGVVFQDYRLLPELNVWENIALALQIVGRPQREIEERVTDLLELVQLTDKAYFFPAELSGGESQRVGIARALSTAPSVLLADEPTGNLDPHTTLMIAKLFHKIHELGTTILFATHDLSILSTFKHRRIHLEGGRLVSDTGASTPPNHEGATKPKTTSEVHTEKKAEMKVDEAKETSKKGFPFGLKLPFGKKHQPQEEEDTMEKKETEKPEDPKKTEISTKTTEKNPPKSDHQKMTEEVNDLLVQIEDL